MHFLFCRFYFVRKAKIIITIYIDFSAEIKKTKRLTRDLSEVTRAYVPLDSVLSATI